MTVFGSFRETVLSIAMHRSSSTERKNRKAFTQKVERLNEEEGTELDSGIFDPKQTF